jgi:hypothetical protein
MHSKYLLRLKKSTFGFVYSGIDLDNNANLTPASLSFSNTECVSGKINTSPSAKDCSQVFLLSKDWSNCSLDKPYFAAWSYQLLYCLTSSGVTL